MILLAGLLDELPDGLLLAELLESAAHVGAALGLDADAVFGEFLDGGALEPGRALLLAARATQARRHASEPAAHVPYGARTGSPHRLRCRHRRSRQVLDFGEARFHAAACFPVSNRVTPLAATWRDNALSEISVASTSSPTRCGKPSAWFISSRAT